MRRFYPYFFVFLFTSLLTFAQQRPLRVLPKQTIKTVKKRAKKTDLGFGLGVARSVVYLARNVKPDNDATGVHASMVYGISRLLRLSLEYTRYQTIDIAPTWYSIRANTIELNAHLLAHFRGKNAFFYPLFGVSYNTFSGFYTGVNDYMNLNSIYKQDQRAVTHWLGVNAGTGYEIFFKPGSFFLDYKMRIGITAGRRQLNIQDVCISAGLRINIKVKSPYGIFVYRGTRSRYLLDKSDED